MVTTSAGRSLDPSPGSPRRRLAAVLPVLILVAVGCSGAVPAANTSSTGTPPAGTSPAIGGGTPPLTADSPGTGTITGTGEANHPHPVPDTVPGATVQVKYRDGTVTLTRDEVTADLISLSDDGSVYTFHAGDPKLATLAPAHVLFLQGLALRVVQKVEPNGDKVVVTTRPATLPEAITDGTISWDAPLTTTAVYTNPHGFDSSGSGPIHTNASPSPSALGFSTVAYSAPRSLTASGTLNDATGSSGDLGDYKYTTTYDVSGGHLHIATDVTRTSKVEANVHLEANITSVESFGSFAFKDGELTQSSFGEKNLQGDVSMTWAARTNVGSDSAGQELLTLPALAEIPVILGGLPFVLGFGAKLVVGVALTSKLSSTEGSFKATYSGDAGAQSTGSANFDPLGGLTSDSSIEPTAGNSGVGADGFFVALAFPRVSIGIGVFGFNEAAYFQLVDTLTAISTSPLGGNICTKDALTTTGEVGVESEIFGSPKLGPLEIDIPGLPSIKKTLFTKDSTLFIPPGASC